jgi:hypothetical protein
MKETHTPQTIGQEMMAMRFAGEIKDHTDEAKPESADSQAEGLINHVPPDDYQLSN